MKSCRIITGGKGQGKTTRILSLSYGAKGFVSVRKGEAYFLHDVETGSERLLMTAERIFSSAIGRWSYDQRVFDYANSKLSELESGVVIIDEVGRLELSGGGFAQSLSALVRKDVDLIIAVRDSFVSSVQSAFGLEDAIVEEVEARL